MRTTSSVLLANLACIELHQMHSRKPVFDKPDYFVMDLDPPEQFKFPDVVEIAFDLREHAARRPLGRAAGARS